MRVNGRLSKGGVRVREGDRQTRNERVGTGGVSWRACAGDRHTRKGDGQA